MEARLFLKACVRLQARTNCHVNRGLASHSAARICSKPAREHAHDRNASVESLGAPGIGQGGNARRLKVVKRKRYLGCVIGGRSCLPAGSRCGRPSLISLCCVAAVCCFQALWSCTCTSAGWQSVGVSGQRYAKRDGQVRFAWLARFWSYLKLLQLVLIRLELLQQIGKDGLALGSVQSLHSSGNRRTNSARMQDGSKTACVRLRSVLDNPPVEIGAAAPALLQIPLRPTDPRSLRDICTRAPRCMAIE